MIIGHVEGVVAVPRAEQPLDQDGSALVALAAGLRELRAAAGGPSYRALARTAHYSATTLSQAAAGRQLPSLEVTLAYVRACGGDEAAWEARWRAVASELNARPITPTARELATSDDGVRAPYIGLRPFRAQDADLFFGRERLLRDVLAAVASRRFVALFGASGSGKSSLLRAGVLPVLTRDPVERKIVLSFTPGEHPVESCAVRLAELVGATTGTVLRELSDDPRGLHRLLLQALAVHPHGAHPDDAEVVMVVDQFEEVFTLCRDPDERDRFTTALVTAAAAVGSRCRVLLGVRSDFYSHCINDPGLAAALRDGQLAVEPMTVEQLRQAITRPARQVDCVVENSLLAELISQVDRRAGVLPLLSHVLLQVWQRRNGNRLTVAALHAAGGVDGALAKTAEDVFAGLDDDQRRTARRLFGRLVAPGEDTEDTSRPMTTAALHEDPALHAVADRFIAARLLVGDRDTVRISHEALIRAWPRLHRWLHEDRDDLHTHRRLSEATDTWLHLHRDPGTLLRGLQLDTTLQWVARGGVPDRAEREFLDASTADDTGRRNIERRRTRRLRQLAALLSVLLVIAAGAVVHAVGTSRTVAAQRDTALSRKVAGQVTTLRATDPTLAAQLGLAAFRLATTAEARSALLSALAVPDATRLTAHRATVESVTVSPDGKFLVTTSADSTARIWDITDIHHPFEVSLLDAHTDGVWSAAFHPSGTLLATTGQDGTVRLWDLTDIRRPAPVTTLHDHSGGVVSAAFSFDGKVLATAGFDHTVRLWDVADDHAITAIGALEGNDVVSTVVFAPRRRVLATTGSHRAVRLWNLTDPRTPVELPGLDGHDTAPTAVAFAPDGTTAASVTHDHAVHLWNLADGRAPRQAAVLTDVGADAVAFSPDGRILATTNLDRTATLHDVTDIGNPDELTVLRGHNGPVVDAVFTPDGHTLITAALDRTARLWSIPGPVLHGHDSAVYATAFSPDGQMLATGSYDGSVRLWDVRDPRRPRRLAVLARHTAAVNSLAFSPDGQLLASASLDRTAVLWNLAEPENTGAVATITGHADSVGAVAFSHDGRTVATGSSDHSLRLWDVTTPDQVRLLVVVTDADDADNVESVAFSPDDRTLAAATSGASVRLWDVTDRSHPDELPSLTGHTNSAKSVAFSPDGTVLATGNADNTVRLWAVRDPRRAEALAVLEGHTDIVHAIVFSADGRTVASASADTTTRLWDISDPDRPTETSVLTGHVGRVYAATFSRDGHTLATGGEDHTTRLWETDVEHGSARICSTLPSPTPAQWAQYFTDLDFRPPCT